MSDKPIAILPPRSTAYSKQGNVGSTLLAGCIAGAVEACVTYPTDLAKTRMQFASTSSLASRPSIRNLLSKIYAKRGLAGFYDGAPSVVFGNALKSCVRFGCYSRLKSLFADENGTVGRMANLSAGLLAGCAESIIAVTPSEALKTRLVADMSSASPRFRSTGHALQVILKEEGFLSLYKGLSSVILKQGTNSAVRFSAYSMLTETYDNNFNNHGRSRSGNATFVLGATAGVITVYASQPFDVTKTRMQAGPSAKGGPMPYSNTFACLYHTAKTESIKALWKGSSMRLVRLSMSGGIQFGVYEKVMEILHNRQTI